MARPRQQPPGSKQEPDTTVSEKAEREQFVATLEALARDIDRGQWGIADAIAEAHAEWGDKYTIAVRITGKKEKTLRNWVSVAGKFEKSRRRDKLTFGHHAVVASVRDEKDREEMLDQAEAKKLTVQELTEAAKKKKVISGSTLRTGEEVDEVPVKIPRDEYHLFIDAAGARGKSLDEEKKMVGDWFLNRGREAINQGAGLAVVKDAA